MRAKFYDIGLPKNQEDFGKNTNAVNSRNARGVWACFGVVDRRWIVILENEWALRFIVLV